MLPSAPFRGGKFSQGIMMKSTEQITALAALVAELPVFAGKLQQFADDLQLDLHAYKADHISLRTHDTELAEYWVEGFRQCATVLSDNNINGRPVYLFLLHQPLALLHWQIQVIELPFPKGKQYAHQGWEHVELVLPGEPDTLTERAAALLPSALPSGVIIKESHPRADNERLPNPTLAVSRNNITIKFHPFTLQEIVESER